MRRPLLLLATGGALAASTAAALGCPACSTDLRLPLAGMALYAVLLLASLLRDDHRLVRLAFMIASGFHLGLICAMVSRGYACPLCLATAACVMAATVLVLVSQRGSWPLVPVVTPWAAAFGLIAAPPPVPLEFPAHTRIVAYTRGDCPFCDELRDRVLPEATRGLAVEIQYRDAAAASFVRRAPTLLVSRGRRHRVLEGLPSVEDLREALRSIGGGHP